MPTENVGQDRRCFLEAMTPSREPIAVLAMACRYPGDISSPEELWDLVAAEKCVPVSVPADRGWSSTRRTGATGNGQAPARKGTFLPEIAHFDADLFTISPREAVTMHPHQRLMLEVAWEACERAGLTLETLRNHRTGVFVGATSDEYGPRAHEASPQARGTVLTGSSPSFVAGRLSYSLGLRGPSLTVDTASSASLVALHLAVQSLRAGECDIAVAGGVSVMTTPAMFTEFDVYGTLAPDGRPKPFAAAADGTAWGEGAGVVVLTRLSEAFSSNRPVLAVIRGSAVNSDGASDGLTAPSSAAQRDLIRQALADATLNPIDVDVVEAHGTGTKLGDVAEATAILETYGAQRPAETPLWLGSLKSNLGHTQAAAGVAGVIKMVMALRNEVLPRTLHVDQPTRSVDWTTGAVKLLTRTSGWPSPGRLRRAAVSSFGLSGTNAHLILEQAPSAETPSRRHVCVLSGATAAGLRAQARTLLAHVRAQTTVPVSDLAWSLATTRTHHAQRAVVPAADRGDLIAGLDALAGGHDSTELVTGVASADPQVVFVLSGAAFDQATAARTLCAARDELLLQESVWQVFWRALALPETGTSTTTLRLVGLAARIALGRRWQAYGVRPAAVIGRGDGAVAAACLSGTISLDEAIERLLREEADPCESFDWGDEMSLATSAEGPLLLVEISPGPVLGDELVAASEQLTDVTVLPVSGDFTAALAQAHVHGVALDWAAVHRPLRPRVVDLPTFSFQRRRYWYDEPGAWLKASVELPGTGALEVAGSLHRGMKDLVGPTGSVTAAAMRTMAVQTGVPAGCTEVADFVLVAPLVVPESAALDVHLSVAAKDELGQRRFTILARSTGGAWTEHGFGTLFPVLSQSPQQTAESSESEDRADNLELVRRCTASVLGHSTATDIAVHRPFRELGVNSLSAMELCGLIHTSTGERLDVQVLFDHPTPAKLAAHLTGRPVKVPESTSADVFDEMDPAGLVRLAFEGSSGEH